MESALKLSLEQEFNLTLFRHQISNLDDQEKDQYLLEIVRQLMIKNNVIQHLLINGDDVSLFENGAVG